MGPATLPGGASHRRSDGGDEPGSGGSFKGKKNDTQQAVEFIDEQIKSYEQRLVAAENSVKQFKLRNAGLLPRLGADYSTQLAAAADALGTARLELAEAEETRQAIAAQIRGRARCP